jgi:tetratricopeptide (TPR) repeat protein
MSWSRLVKSFAPNAAVVSAVLAILVAVGVATRQWFEKPIAIGSFTVVNDADKLGITPSAIADQLRAHISQINEDSGDLFESRKLVDNAIPLDIKLGNTGWTFATLTKAFNVSFTSAEVAGRVSEEGKYLILDFTTSQGNRIYQDTYPIPLPALVAPSSSKVSPSHLDPDSAFRVQVNHAISCLAFNVVMKVSPDVAANYLHKHESHDPQSPEDLLNCIHTDDVALYSEVSRNRLASPYTRVNALVGLSVHYSESQQYYEEVAMADAAKQLAGDTMGCDDPVQMPWWVKLRCLFFLERRETNRRAQIAAWMQTGAAYADYANIAPTFGEMLKRRQKAIDAYRHVIGIANDYALAYDALGLQYTLLGKQDDAAASYTKSIQLEEAPPAHMDLGLHILKGRNDVYTKQQFPAKTLDDAETEFMGAITRQPDYWEGHIRLGYVLYEKGQLREAADAVTVALSRNRGDRHLRRFLASVYADMCEVEPARRQFSDAYQESEQLDRDALHSPGQQPAMSGRIGINGLNTMSDWGKALDGFGLRDAALEQENQVLAQNPKHIDALVFRGLIQIKIADSNSPQVEAGLADLKAAAESESPKSAFAHEAYLISLIKVNRANEAIDQYKRWAARGDVPPPVKNAVDQLQSIPPNTGFRRLLVRALLMEHQWTQAAEELSIQTQMGLPIDLLTFYLQPTAGGSIGDEDEPSPHRACRLEPKYQRAKLRDVDIRPLIAMK